MPDWCAVRNSIGVALMTFVLALGVIYVGACWLFWAYEPAFVVYQLKRPGIAPEAAGLKGFTEVSVTTEAGVRLYGWWGPPEPGRGAIVAFTATGAALAADPRPVWDL